MALENASAQWGNADAMIVFIGGKVLQITGQCLTPPNSFCKTCLYWCL